MIFEITDEDLKLLDQFEGEVPEGAFYHLPVTVVTEDGDKTLVTTYAAKPIGKFKPKAHYLEWVMKGLKHWQMPDECLELWQSFFPK
jgi:gamma-glutamylcyclotransferase